tara:strand:+ start:364 stop:780 length:417 start_codon:yes stop_codon:yes gene_type:complete
MWKQIRKIFTKIRLDCFKSKRKFSVFLFAILASCSYADVEKAFNGDFRPGKSNKVIGEYCQSCHIHKDFDPPRHVANVRSLYKTPVFRKARECRSCHYIEKNWMYNRHGRKTRMPTDANKGKYRKFEKKEINKLKKNR